MTNVFFLNMVCTLTSKISTVRMTTVENWDGLSQTDATASHVSITMAIFAGIACFHMVQCPLLTNTPILSYVYLKQNTPFNLCLVD